MSGDSLFGGGVATLFGGSGKKTAAEEEKRRKQELDRQKRERSEATEKMKTAGQRAGSGATRTNFLSSLGFGGGNSSGGGRPNFFGN